MFYASLGYQPNPCHIMQRWLDGREAPGIETDREDGKLETTITYLEITERPPHPHVVPPHGMKTALLRARRPSCRLLPLPLRYAWASHGYGTSAAPWTTKP